jgi:flagellar protein FlaJ
MVSPVWYLPPVVVVVAVGAWLGAKVDPQINRIVSRFARVIFDRFVSPNADRERTIQSAYIGESYRSYASKTLLYTVLAFVASFIAGGYVVAGVLVVFEDFVRLLTGLPDTIAVPLGARINYQLVLSGRERWAILLGGGAVFGLVAAGLAYLLRWQLPTSNAEVRRRSIDEGLPRTTAFMYALSRGGLEFPAILRSLSENREVYGETAAEMSITVREMDLFGRDMITALRRMAERTPSEQFKTFSENIGSVLQSGSSLSEFLSERYERFREDAEERQAEILEVLATIAEGYVTVLVAGVLFLITILLVFGLTTTDTLWLLTLMAYLMIPLANAGFAVFLSQKLDDLGISRSGGAEILDRHEVQTPIRERPAAARQRADGGVSGDIENQQTLAGYDRLESIKNVFQNPFRTIVWNPSSVLYVVVPIAVLAAAIRFPDALTGVGVNIRALDDILIQSVLFVLITYAVVREFYARRIKQIEAATPELLERLASLNEAGMSMVEGFTRLRGSDLGVLSPEVDRIWRDLQYGSNAGDALIRFGRRVRTTTVTRLVILLTNAMEASGNMGPVLRIAAEQSRSDLKLRQRRRQQMFTYLVVIYISFIVFLVIIVAVNEVLVPSLPESVPAPEESDLQRLGVGTGIAGRLGSVDKAAYTLVFFHTALVQAVVSGFIGGQLGGGSLKDGAKHAGAMLTIAYVAFLLISSPVASIAATDAVSTGETIRIEGASLSNGGYVVAYDDGIDTERLGRSEYVPPGTTESGILIQLDRPIRENRTVYLVAHQDTNDNKRFDYTGPPLPPDGASPDMPYPSSTGSRDSGIEVTVEYAGSD